VSAASTLSVATDDESYVVHVDIVWMNLLAGDQNRTEETVDGLCTIIKWGDTMQLRKSFRLVIELEE